jgi:quercetin dioxygenase-like cupin family protein
MTTHGDADSMSPAAAVAPIALGPGEGEALWFLGELVTVKASSASTAGRVAVSEHRAPRGSGSPLHVHRNGVEWFYVTEGEQTIWVGRQVIAATAGSFVYVPRDIPHTFKVDSEQARFLLVVQPADVAQEAVTADEYGSEVLGPPGIPA